jgi:hypothetical protein
MLDLRAAYDTTLEEKASPKNSDQNRYRRQPLSGDFRDRHAPP